MDAIGHVDADCFYVSAERVRFPHLAGVPVGVLGNHGACVIAKSYEMKAAGVKTGDPIWEALPRCPNGVYVKRDFEWYEVLSRKMLAIVRELSPQVEFYSIDESFFTIPKPSLQDAQQLQRLIKEQVGVPVSVGIAPTKTLAKLISDAVKPFSCGIALSAAERAALLTDLPVTEISGIAKRSATKLAPHGITTCAQFAAADRRLIRKLLTKRGEDLWFELNGDPVLPVQVSQPRHKFIARGGSIGQASGDFDRVQAFVVRNIERLTEALAYYRLCCDQLMLSLLFTDAPERSLRSGLLGSRGDYEALVNVALELLPLVWRPPTAKVNYMHVIAGGLRPLAERQLGLFDDRLGDDLKLRINQTVGRFAVRSGATLPLHEVYGDSANNYDICDVYGKSCF